MEAPSFRHLLSSLLIAAMLLQVRLTFASGPAPGVSYTFTAWAVNEVHVGEMAVLCALCMLQAPTLPSCASCLGCANPPNRVCAHLVQIVRVKAIREVTVQ